MTQPPPRSAMVFAAGLGTRMRPITDALPKPLVQVAGRTMLDHMLDRLAEAGVERAVVNVHYRADQIENSLRGRQRPAVVISDERSKLLDQGGGLVKARAALGPHPFLICNTDAIWIEREISNLRRLASAWDAARMDVLLLVASTTASIGVDWDGDFTLDLGGRLRRRREGQSAPFVYAGVGIIKPELFAAETRDIFKLAPYFFDAAERGRLFGVALDGTWLHVGTPAAIAEAEAVFLKAAQ